METPEKQEELQTETSFDSVKESASDVLGGLMGQIKRLEEAMKLEHMGDVYQIYWNELPASIQQSSNANHEIDNFLTSKLDQEIQRTFPFMIMCDVVSPILMNYQIGSYYRERAVLQVDATQPTIKILPEIRDQWEKVMKGEYKEQLSELENQQDDFDAKTIAAQSELRELNGKIAHQEKLKAELEETKSFMNRKKIEEEIEVIDDKLRELKQQRSQWTPFVGDQLSGESQKIELANRIASLSLEQAIALKELRLIKKRFGGLEEMDAALEIFIKDFLNKGAE
ncbi:MULTISPECIES: hypothetical protein [Enterococcus]|uniref:Viral A-type inclusion protein n=1 Tax=Enterococcus malodoratus ATCC 43197 TaxID=1158601 RepID=R2PES1_9ENTE|nr:MULTISPECIES: hypothetical protein [Enterococcus]BBM18128.1 hypothetical protein G15_1792 [Enterococcus avium]EOH82852.1 hypothetical protein UAI_00247 [Enterococcus malodoratus ATCC 43197]EOT70668.1 hypothetical protein I585_00179 [Enterococcus malodoratus ATCC 43197]OJG64790.1 hypothetical protein RV07_GL003743 [Enterococcus malodoratus]SET01422.1 hypothetical protein SAMN04487821_10516 [Enterococcus malodoratus]